jgi:hypothetical protein
MRKGFLIMLAVVLVAAIAAPAMAEVSLTGFYRAAAITSNFERNAGSDLVPFKSDGPFGAVSVPDPYFGGTKSFKPGTYGEFIIAQNAPFQSGIYVVNTKAPASGYVDQRARMRFEAKSQDVGFVGFFEIDMRWGDTQYVAARNQGGGLEADSINLETKNVYVWFKPNANTTVNVGLQNYTDPYAGVLFGAADFAGVTALMKVEPANLVFVYAKLKDSTSPGDLLNKKNADVDLLALQASMSPTKDARVGLNFHFINDRGFQGTPGNAITVDNTASKITLADLKYSNAKIYVLGLDGSFNVAAPLTLSAFAFYQFGTIKDFTAFDNNVRFTEDVKVKAYVADIRADVAAGPGKGFLELLYVSGMDPNSDSKDYKGIVNGSNYANAGSLYSRTDMEIMLPNPMDGNSGQALVYDPKGPTGLGLLHIGAGYTMPLAQKLTGKVGLGWAQTAKSFGGSDFLFAKKGIGTEVNARLTYSITKGLDLMGTGAYCWLGDAFEQKNSSGVSLKGDNLYKMQARLNYAF